ncbi:division/cell wall cluster transcriptional repressor MraZ [candidate division WOR-3 bacterium]|nr:division/cell wall cluster transcriptional repressor MraZ [candidate division WOR-3 bacterium]
MGFYGTHKCTIDDKGRFFLPVRYRKDLNENKMFLTRGFDRCLNLYTVQDWEEFEKKLLGLPASKNDVRNVLRYFIGSGDYMDIDGKGRMKIPAELLSFADIKREMTAVGRGNVIEIWSHANYMPVMEKIDKNIVDYFESLGI